MNDTKYEYYAVVTITNNNNNNNNTICIAPIKSEDTDTEALPILHSLLLIAN